MTWVWGSERGTYGDRVISRAWAIDVVERHLLVEAAEQASPPMVVIDVERHALGWLIICQSPRYARTRDPADALVGHGPFLVDAGGQPAHGAPAVLQRRSGMGGPVPGEGPWRAPAPGAR
ncbi:YrhB domain-containing protein [Streptomyces sp. NPDC096193]|uniref:YrhB domain-containing protein n=1 Tax=Streptomyces sp. NPDC096193 TaxID=3155821 RepID=UPI00332CCD7C